MPVDALAIVAGNRLFSIERCPDNSGVRFVLTEPGGKRKWSAAIIDCGDEFALAMGSEDGIRLRTFTPSAILRTQSGKNAPLSDDKQINIETPYRTMIVRNLHSDDSPVAVVVGYIDKDDGIVRSVALCQANCGSLMFSLAN